MADIPWQYSQALGQYYYYSPVHDQLVLQDGRRLPRPETLSIESLAAAAYHESNADFSTSPPQGSRNYVTAAQAGSSARPDMMSIPRTTAPLVPSGLFRRNPDNEDELIAPISISAGTAPRLDPPLTGMASTAIASAEVQGMETEKLYPEFKIRKQPKEFFFVGKVFKILWPEPMGSNAAGANTVVTSKEEAVITGKFGEAIFSKVRRFVVVRQANGYCNALPISTYGGRGVAKPHLTKAEHAIIYTTPLPQPLLSERAKRGEEPMRPIAIRVDPDTRAEKLDPKSRVNFGHLHTIQYNVRVKSCGKVPDECISDLISQWRSVLLPALSTSASSSSVAASRTATADDRVQKALTALIEGGMSQQEAIRKMIESLEGKGMEREDAVDLIRKALQ